MTVGDRLHQELDERDAIATSVILVRAEWTTPETRLALLRAKADQAVQSLERIARERWGE